MFPVHDVSLGELMVAYESVGRCGTVDLVKSGLTVRVGEFVKVSEATKIRFFGGLVVETRIGMVCGWRRDESGGVTEVEINWWVNIVDLGVSVPVERVRGVEGCR